MGLIQNKVTVSQPNSHVVVKNAGGLRGLTGETGPQGPQGVPGEAATVTAGTTTTLPAGSDATVQNVGSTSAAIFNFGIPKGDKGDTGETGAAATISVGSTSTLPAGSSATVTNSGTSSAAVFDFGIPKGDKGDTGATGADGYSPSATVTKTGDTATITITDKDGTTTASISDGTTPTVNDGTLTIQKNGTTVQTFSADQASNVTANITVPTQFSELSGTVSSSQIEDEAITTGSVSGTGTNITLSGTMEGGAIESVELNGDTQQTTYSGKNKLTSTSHLVSSDNGITVSLQSDGSIKATGTVGSSWNGFNLAFYNTDTIPSGQYTFSIDHSISSAIAVAFRTSDNSNLGNITIPAGSTSATGTISGAIGKSSLWVSATTGTSINFTIKAQLESGSTATSFEPYAGGTASPNPDYPQEVQTVTGEQSVEVRGSKNMFDKNAITSGYLVGRADGILAANVSYGASDFIRVQEGETYTFSSGFNYWYSAYYDSNKQYVGYPTNTATITVPAGVSYIRTSFLLTNLDTAQFEKGSTATTYEPYKGVAKTVNLGKNLLDNYNPTVVSANTTWTPTENGGLYTATSGWTGGVKWKLTVEEGSTYQFQYKERTDQHLFLYITTYTDSTYTTVKTRIVNDGRYTKYPIVPDSPYLEIQFQNSSAITDVAIEELMFEKAPTRTTYAPYFTPIELCKIGTYQDYIYKSGEDWYVHKETGKVTFTGAETETWSLAQAATGYFRASTASGESHADNNGYCNEFINRGSQAHGAYEYVWVQPNANAFYIQVLNTRANDVSSFKTWLSTHPATIYYDIAPTDTQITNATLISELEDLLSATTYSGTTYITVSGDLASPLEVVAEADSKLAPDSVYGAAIKDGAVSTDKIEDGAVTPAKISTSAYQSGETAVGTWIDGKTIYRQVLTGTTQITANNVATVTTTIAAKSIVSTSGWYQSWKQNDTTSNKVAFGQLMGNNIYSYALIRSGNYIELGFISSVNVNSQYEVVVEYTKKD